MTTFSDNFNRANGGLGANYLTANGHAPVIATNVVNAAAGVTAIAIVDPGVLAFGADQKAEVLCGNIAANTRYAGAVVRMTSAGNGYEVYTDGSSGAGHTEIAKVVSGVETVIANFALTFTSTDTIGIESSGTTQFILKNGVRSGSVVDATYASGQPGISAFDVVGLDNFSASDGATAVQLEDPSRRTAAQVAATRQPPAMPQAIRAGLAVFLTGVQGPTVPAGSSAGAQAVVAYREASRLPRAPIPVITQGGAAPAAYIPPAALPLPKPPASWPYASVQASATASQFGIPDVDLIFDRLKPDIVEQQPWVHSQVAAAAATPEIAALIPAAAAVPPVSTAIPVQRDWPYHEFALPDTAGVAAPLFGATPVYLGGPPVRLPPPQPWPYASAVCIEFGPAAITFVAPLPPTFVPTLVPVEQFWPHALLQPRPTQFIGITPVQIAPSPVPALPAPPWPYVSVMQGVGPAALLPAPTVQLAGPAVMPLQAPSWSYAAVADLVLGPAATLAPQPAPVPPPSVVLPVAAPPWPYAGLQKPPRLLAQVLPAPPLPLRAVIVAARAAWPYTTAMLSAALVQASAPVAVEVAGRRSEVMGSALQRKDGRPGLRRSPTSTIRRG
jgi:hypothetical protein